MKTENIALDIKDNIAFLYINDPPANIMTLKLYTELIYTYKNKIAKSNLKGVIITGEGRHYSSGADIENLKKSFSSESKYTENQIDAFSKKYLDLRNTYNAIYNSRIPVISAISGICVGGAFELALSSHIKICTKNALVGLPESTFKILPGLYGSVNMLKDIGYGKSLELILKGEVINSKLAFEYGLIDFIVDKKNLIPYCVDLIEYINNNNISIDRTKIFDIIKKCN